MTFQQPIYKISVYFLVTLAFISLLLSLGCSKHLVRAPDKLENYDITSDVLKTIPKGLAKKYHCIPLDRIGNIISFVVSDPVNLMELKKQEQYLNCKMQFFLTTPTALTKALKKFYEKADISE